MSELSAGEISGLIAAFMGAVGSLGGAVKMLLSYYFRQQRELEKLRAANGALERQAIKDMLDNFKLKLDHFKSALDVVNAKLKSNALAAERVIQAQIAFVSNVEKQLKLQNEKIDEIFGIVKVK